MRNVNDIRLRLIFNSFGDETIEAVINKQFSASCPGGISRSSFEARTLSVKDSIINFESLCKRFKGRFDQKGFDSLLKENSTALGATATTALSLAFFEMDFECKKRMKFPNLLGNVIGGGEHSMGKGMEIQEILTIPNEKSMFDAVKTNFVIWNEVKDVLRQKGKLFGLNPESAWIAGTGNEDSLELVKKVAEKYGADIGIDFAASSIFRDGKYFYRNKTLLRAEQIDYAINLAKTYGMKYMEDPLEENDFSGFGEISRKLKKTMVCGDDLIASDPKRLMKMKKAVSAVIVKPNQIGNVSDCLRLMRMASKNHISPVVSHRSKETCCTAVAKLALNSPFAKFGIAGIRTSKLNELIRLWDACESPTMSKANL